MPITIPAGASLTEMVALKGKPDIGDQINKKIIDTGGGQAIMLVRRLAEPDRLSGAGGGFILIGGSGKLANLSGGRTCTIDYPAETDARTAHGRVNLGGRYSIR